jgi:serine/threonine protein kinase/tetratricopeptide (TPR) repeat protein
MGEVYRATDLNLGRDIALKVLPAEMARDADRLARFQREARAVAALNHPNVVTVYSVEESDGLHFITMELIEGQALERLIPADGLPVERFVEIAGGLAEALAAAHEKGIVHRDLKPANVMVTNGGRVKVLDFGLAKDVGAANSNATTVTSAGMTQAGVVMGTPAYMSPEQVTGRMLDHRTDIFSLGVVLHEMATGSRPFEGASAAELISSILRDEPPDVTEIRPGLPADLARVIRRCLEKDPRHRVQTARDVSNEFRDFERSGARPATFSIPTPKAVSTHVSGAARTDEGFWVAVLPFKYSSSADLKALAEGISDEVITGLARFSYLRVVARGSTAKYSSESGDVRAIGKELGARYVMEGSIRQAGGKLRLAVQLTDTATGTHLWAENYERVFSPDALFELQDDLVPRIVSTVADYYGILPRTICDAIRRRKADDQLSPYEAVLRAFSYFERISPEEHAHVREILERAVQSAPDRGEIWAMLSTVYWHEHALGLNPRPDPLGRALAAARRSIEAAPTNNLGYSALATVHYFQHDLLAFRAQAERAIELNPMDGSNLAHVGLLMADSGDWERGIALAEAALRLNPHHPGWYWFAPFRNAYRKGDYQGALSIVLKINMPGYFLPYAFTAAVYGQLGMREPAQNSIHQLLALRPDFAATARAQFGKTYDAELVEHLIDGLRKAGLEIAEEVS